MADDPYVVRLEGEFDTSRRGQLAATLQAARGAQRVLLDLTAVTYVDSTALDEIFRLRRALDANGGRIAVAIASRDVMRLFSIAGLTPLLPTFGSLEEARDDLA